MPFITTGALQGFLTDRCGRRSLRCRSPARRGFQAAKKSERTVRAYAVPPRCAHRLYSTIAKCWRIAGCAAIPAEQAGRRKPPAPFLLGADAHPLHRLRCRRSAYILRSQQPRTAAAPQLWNTREPAILTSGIGCSRRFQPYGTTFGAGGLPTSASFRADSPFNYKKNVCYTFHRAQEREWTTAEWQRKSSDWWILAMVMHWCCSQRTARWRKSAR